MITIRNTRSQGTCEQDPLGLSWPESTAILGRRPGFSTNNKTRLSQTHKKKRGHKILRVLAACVQPGTLFASSSVLVYSAYTASPPLPIPVSPSVGSGAMCCGGHIIQRRRCAMSGRLVVHCLGGEALGADRGIDTYGWVGKRCFQGGRSKADALAMTKYPAKAGRPRSHGTQ